MKFGEGQRSGRKPLAPELRAIQCRSKADVKRLINLYLDMPREQLKKKLESPTTPAIELYLASIIATGIKDADWRMFSFLLDRIVGPVKTDDTDIGELRAQVEAELRLAALPIEDVRKLATGMIALDVEVVDDESSAGD
jgi:hypothetical protein